jgi:ArsR family transcriptional regulator
MRHKLNDAMIGEASGLFGALGDQSRLFILRALLDAEEPLNQGAIAEAAGLSQANASKHLACLARVGLIQREPIGNTVLYTPVLPLVATLCELVCGHVTRRAKSTYQALR